MSVPEIVLPGPFVEWLEGTGAFQTQSTQELVALQDAVGTGRRRNYGSGFTVTIKLEEGVQDDLVEWAGYFDNAVSDEATPAELRANKTLKERLAAL